MNRLSLWLLLFLFTCGSTFSQERKQTNLEMAFHGISSNEIMGFIEKMCDPEFKGRLAGSPEYNKCAHWAANLFSEWGLTPGGDKEHYFQNFPIQYTDVKSAGTFQLLIGKDVKQYAIDVDYYPGTHTASGELKAKVVYIGFGISAKNFEYDDYAGIDVKGKIVVIESGTPCADSKHGDFIQWDTTYAGANYKMKNAIDHGAAGVLFAGMSSHPGIIYNNGMIYCHINKSVTDDILGAYSISSDSIKKKIRATRMPNSLLTDKEVLMRFESTHVEHSVTCNVIGYIKGNDNRFKDSPIIVGAHLDHLGNPGILFPGAMDNASGSAVVMSVAKAMAQSKIKPLRPIIFILFGAEEPGMVGSRYYIKNPLFPLSKTLCMLNLDMVGNGTELYVDGVNTFPSVKKYFTDANDKYTHRILNTSNYKKAIGKVYTDGAMFNKNSVTSFSVGADNEVGVTYYHKPADLPCTMIPEIMEDMARMLFVAVTGLSNDEKIFTK